MGFFTDLFSFTELHAEAPSTDTSEAHNADETAGGDEGGDDGESKDEGEGEESGEGGDDGGDGEGGGDGGDEEEEEEEEEEEDEPVDPKPKLEEGMLNLLLFSDGLRHHYEPHCYSAPNCSAHTLPTSLPSYCQSFPSLVPSSHHLLPFLAAQQQSHTQPC